MINNTQLFDHWIRSTFIEINTALEEMYFVLDDPADVEHVGTAEKQQLRAEGEAFIKELLAEGNTDEGFDQAFDLLGNVGLFMAACRRHEITEPSREHTSPLVDASALAMHIAASIGVIPRFATAHLTTHNKAHNGKYKSFTTLADEKLFIDYNTKAILAYKRAADALLKIQPLGISHFITNDLLRVANQALQDVIDSNNILFDKLNSDRFFYSVRPYYKPHRVGSQIYRGANAGDFAGINVIDMQLGLCFANEPSYSRILVEKLLYMMPEDQQILRDCMRRKSLMDDFLDAQDARHEAWYQENLAVFLQVVQRHGEAAAQHHDQLVSKYIVNPSATMEEKHMDKLTASGPPLPVLVRSLENLRDRRAARERYDIRTRYDDIEQLKGLIS